MADFERNARDPGRLDGPWAPYLVSGLRVIALLNQFHLLSAEAKSNPTVQIGVTA